MYGTFTGRAASAIDEETGFVFEPETPQLGPVVRSGGYISQGWNGANPGLILTPAKKLLALNRLWDVWPDITEACKGICCRSTFMNHYHFDDSFRECVDWMRDRVIDRIESVRMKVAMEKSGSFDRMCVLNSYRKEIYNPRIAVDVNYRMTPQEAKESYDRMEDAVDAEIVSKVRLIQSQNRKEVERVSRRNPIRPQNPKAK